MSFTTVKTFVKWLKLMKLKLGKLKHHKLLVLRVQFQKVIFNSNDMRNYCYPCIFSFVYCTQLFLSLWLHYQQMLKLKNAKNTMTLIITAFNQLQLRPLVCMASPLPLFWVALQRNLLICLVIPGSACPWLWSKGMLPAYWPVCKFYLILTIPSVLTQWLSTAGPWTDTGLRRCFANLPNNLNFPSSTSVDFLSSRPNWKWLAFMLNSIR